MRRICAALAVVAFSPFLTAEEETFEAIADDYEGKARIVRTLDEITLKDVRIDTGNISEAVGILQRLGRGDKPQGGVINFVIRSPRDSKPAADPAPDDPFSSGADGAKNPNQERPARIVLREDSISFAQAIDRVCNQAGFRWAIDIDDGSPPCLILSPNPK